MQTPVKLLLVATLCLGGALGFLAGRGTAPPADSSDDILRALERQEAMLEALPTRLIAASAQTHCAVAAPAGANLDAAWLRAELTRILREELDGSGRGSAPKAPESPPPSSPQSLAAVEASQRLIEDASRSRRWRAEDARSIRRLLDQMTDAQRKEVTRQLLQALNAGGIEMQVQGPPF